MNAQEAIKIMERKIEKCQKDKAGLEGSLMCRHPDQVMPEQDYLEALNAIDEEIEALSIVLESAKTFHQMVDNPTKHRMHTKKEMYYYTAEVNAGQDCILEGSKEDFEKIGLEEGVES